MRPNCSHASLAITLLLTLSALTAAAEPNWPSVPLVRHDTLQAVNGDGSSAYAGGYPLRLRGIVLNNPEDWLDPTPAFSTIPWDLGGEWEIFIQAWDDPNQTYDDGDFGGTACWMGQNYGNLPWIGDPNESYTDAEWPVELARLDLAAGPNQPLRAGDLVEVRARAGLPYAGKLNVNEQHNKRPEFDFEIVVIEPSFGLPQPVAINLDSLKDANDAFIWDASRQVGGERYQSARVLIRSVQLVEPAGWGPDTDVELVDATGRTLTLHLGRDSGFAGMSPPTATFNVVGVLNQESQSGVGGYYVIAMSTAGIVCGDADCDGVCDFGDINPFVMALIEPDTYAATYPGCIPDLTGDFVADFSDINPFVAALLYGGCP